MDVKPHFSLSFYSHSKQLGGQRDLASHLPFFHALQLPFSQHIHHRVTLECSPGCFKRKEAHPWLHQSLDEPVILFDQIIELFHAGVNSTC